MPDQTQKSKTFVKGVTLENKVGGRTEKYSYLRHERRWSSEKMI